MGEEMGPMFEGLAKVAGALDMAPNQWVNMETDELPENALAAGRIKARSAMFMWLCRD